ncbi:MAG: VOC family protein [Polyangiaceae bacterium]|nr:VOC family protein [Polyangiaceae bacterium]
MVGQFGVGCLGQPAAPDASAGDPRTAQSADEVRRDPVEGRPATVRYQVADVERSIAFYTAQLGFRLGQRTGPVFAEVSLGQLRLLLSGPGSSGSRPMPDGRKQEPGGWNRIVLYVDDLESEIRRFEKAGGHLRNAVEVGPGGKQVQIEDPDGNPIELHEAAKR